ncbi:MAG: polysaccharide pyruvyl transferase family protein, partial [Steroidobacteraceae bacterium]
ALWWMEGPYPGNFGDVLNPYVIEKLSGRPPRYAPRGQCLLAIGSTVKFATEQTVVWGAGTPRMGDRLHPQADYRAVRGPLTRELVLQSGASCPPVYGDPSWFLPRLYRPARAARRYRMGLVLHHSNTGELEAGEGVKLISVIRGSYQEIESFIDELHECDCVLSTSLHGLIVAHAYGIPARWCEVADSAAPLPGDGTKFRDYLLTVGLESEHRLSVPRGTLVTLDQVREAQGLPRQQIDLDALAAAAPFHIAARWC